MPTRAVFGATLLQAAHLLCGLPQCSPNGTSRILCFDFIKSGGACADQALFLEGGLWFLGSVPTIAEVAIITA